MPHPRRLPSFIATIAAVGSWLASTHASATELGTNREPSSIIGGAPVDSCEWPSVVWLENCTGTLIHPEIVVYAAHCGEAERAWFGEALVDGQIEPADGFSVETEYCWTNPDYPLQFDIGPSRAADFAFCKLAEPVLDVPIVPPLVGCETTVLTSGADVTLVGWGGTDQETIGVKFQVDTELHYIDDWGAAVIGGAGKSPCAGDSGGPAFVQMPDGTWRSFGIVSGPNFGNCGDAMWFATIHTAIPHIERESGIDVTACHHGNGQWNPSPSCREFPLEPWNGEGRAWADGCGGGPTAGWSTTCGPAFDESEDLQGPTTALLSPDDRTRFDTTEGADTVSVIAEAEASDVPSGVSSVQLVIDGAVVDGSLRLGPPWRWDLQLPVGVWEMQTLATDWAGNEAYSPAIVVGVDRDPPAAEEPSTSTGPEVGDASSSGSADETSSGGDESSTGTGGDPAIDDGTDDGCGCRSGGPGASMGWLLFGLVPLLLRRRRRAWPLCVAAVMACSNEPSGSDESSTGSTGQDADSSTTDASTGVPTSTSGDGSSSESGSSEGVPACEVGTLDCSCHDDYTCETGLACYLATCVPCEPGTITCPCREPTDEVPACDDGLFCFGGRCSSPQPCPFPENGVCNEPEGGGGCLEGTDYFDCCPTQSDVCEEAHAGGVCPDGSDPMDCGTTGDTTGSSSDDGGSDSSGTAGTGGSTETG